MVGRLCSLFCGSGLGIEKLGDVMSWDLVIVLVGFVACWFFAVVTGFNMGIKYERFRHDKEVDAYVIPEENLGDEEYWKMRYEDLADEMEEMYPLDQIR